MIKLKMLGALTLMGLVAACTNPPQQQQQVITAAPVAQPTELVAVPVGSTVKVVSSAPAQPRTKVVAASSSRTTVVSTGQLVSTGENKTTTRIDLGLVKERPANIPAIVAERMTDSVPSVQIVYRLEDRECKAVRAKYGDAAVIRNEAEQTCTVNRGRIQKPQ